MPLPRFLRRLLWREDAATPVAGRGDTPQDRIEHSFPALPTLEQQRQMKAKLRDFDPAYDAEVHAKMKAIHELMEREHR